MRIALDYDNTYSADPTFWDSFIVNARHHGHEVFIVTARDERFDRTAPLVELEKKSFALGGPLKIWWCRGVAKKWFMHHFGVDVDVWVDDKPESIFANSPTPRDELAQWRAGHLFYPTDQPDGAAK